MRFAVTLTIKPKWFRFDATTQYDNTHTELETLLELDKVVLLVAELTKNANVHYHLIYEDETSELKLNKQLKDKSRISTNAFGFVCVKQLTDEPGWVEYLSKSILTTKELIGRPPILIDLEMLIPLEYPYIRAFGYELDGCRC